MRVYTRSGDAGETGLLFGGRVSKTDPRCEAYGTTDQAVSAMGLARALSQDDRVKAILKMLLIYIIQEFIEACLQLQFVLSH